MLCTCRAGWRFHEALSYNKDGSPPFSRNDENELRVDVSGSAQTRCLSVAHLHRKQHCLLQFVFGCYSCPCIVFSIIPIQLDGLSQFLSSEFYVKVLCFYFDDVSYPYFEVPQIARP
jgi:hypothetical protein